MSNIDNFTNSIADTNSNYNENLSNSYNRQDIIPYANGSCLNGSYSPYANGMNSDNPYPANMYYMNNPNMTNTYPTSMTNNYLYNNLYSYNQNPYSYNQYVGEYIAQYNSNANDIYQPHPNVSEYTPNSVVEYNIDPIQMRSDIGSQQSVAATTDIASTNGSYLNRSTNMQCSDISSSSSESEEDNTEQNRVKSCLNGSCLNSSSTNSRGKSSLKKIVSKEYEKRTQHRNLVSNMKRNEKGKADSLYFSQQLPIDNQEIDSSEDEEESEVVYDWFAEETHKQEISLDFYQSRMEKRRNYFRNASDDIEKMNKKYLSFSLSQQLNLILTRLEIDPRLETLKCSSLITNRRVNCRSQLYVEKGDKVYGLIPQKNLHYSSMFELHSLSSILLRNAIKAYDIVVITEWLGETKNKLENQSMITTLDLRRIEQVPIILYRLIYRMSVYADTYSDRALIEYNAWMQWLRDDTNYINTLDIFYPDIQLVSSEYFKSLLEKTLKKYRNVITNPDPLTSNIPNSTVEPLKEMTLAEYMVSQRSRREHTSALRITKSKDIRKTIPVATTRVVANNKRKNDEISEDSIDIEDYIQEELDRIPDLAKTKFEIRQKKKLLSSTQSESANTMHIWGSLRDDGVELEPSQMTDHYGDYLKLVKGVGKYSRRTTLFRPLQDDNIVVILYDMMHTIKDLNIIYSENVNKYAASMNKEYIDYSAYRHLCRQNKIDESIIRKVQKCESILEKSCQRLIDEWCRIGGKQGIRTIRSWIDRNNEDFSGPRNLLNIDYQLKLSQMTKKDSLYKLVLMTNPASKANTAIKQKKNSYISKTNLKHNYQQLLLVFHRYMNEDAIYLGNIIDRYKASIESLVDPLGKKMTYNKTTREEEYESQQEKNSYSALSSFTCINALYYFIIIWSVEMGTQMHKNANANIARTSHYHKIAISALMHIESYFRLGGWSTKFKCPETLFLTREYENAKYLAKIMEFWKDVDSERYQSKTSILVDRILKFFTTKFEEHATERKCYRCFTQKHQRHLTPFPLN